MRLKPLFAALAAASVAACQDSALLEAATAKASAGGPAQVEEGSILLPLRFPADATYASWPGGQRNVYTAVGSNGDVGYTFELSEVLGGGAFQLEVLSGATGAEDLDITFYASFNPVVSTGDYTERAAAGEAGTVPPGSRFAIVTMFTGADAAFRFTGFAPVLAPGLRDLPPVELPPPGIHATFGRQGGDVVAWAQRLRARPHVVIALIDTGINPYHLAYRRPDYAVHPSLYIDGFPGEAPAIGLTRDPDYVVARTADDPTVWSQVGTARLYWIPGTNIVGAYSIADYEGVPPGGLASRPIIDDDGHGTGTSSVAAGARFGANSDALIVMVEGLGDAAVQWASEQPWIDFISGSYGDALALPCNDSIEDDGIWCGREYRFTAPFVLRDGRTACFSAGNGLSRTGVLYDRYSSLRPTSGPSWVISVGAVSPRNGQDYGWHSVPVDVSSYGNHWPAADAFSTAGETDFSGTSNATPVTCGVFSRALLAARRAMGDAVEGIHGKDVAAVGRAQGGLMGDGVLRRQELQDAVLKTALPESFDESRWLFDPIIVPDNPAYYTQEGYGIANIDSALRAIDVIAGRAPMPDRSEVDAWIAEIDALRDAIYPPPPY
jgi:hypothetical protein